jgi:hypothetical protein
LKLNKILKICNVLANLLITLSVCFYGKKG